MLHPREVAAAPVGRRTAVIALSAVLVVPALLLFGFLLAWFLPEATGYTCAAADPACDPGAGGTVVWWLLLATVVHAAVAHGVGWWRLSCTGPWWPWPVLGLASVAVASVLTHLLVGG